MQSIKTLNFTMENDIAAIVYGQNDDNLNFILSRLGAKVIARGGEIVITGVEADADLAYKLFEKLADLAAKGNNITASDITYLLGAIAEGLEEDLNAALNEVLARTTRGRLIKAKTIGQYRYIKSIKKNDISFGIGPAGTGKTYLAVVMAVNALKEKQVNRIILTRPAVEAGEKLGFLPGDLQEKVDPYLRPLYDGLYDVMGLEIAQRNIEKGVIEIAPLAYMRGRTLDDSFIILDEAQNTTVEQMKMFLTRIGMNSKAVVTGDVTQVDIGKNVESGLVNVQKILKGVSGISFNYLTKADVVRHPVVQRIINAYEEYERKHEYE